MRLEQGCEFIVAGSTEAWSFPLVGKELVCNML